VALIEKAYVQWNETGRAWCGSDSGVGYYTAIAGGWMCDVYPQLLGRTATDYSLPVASRQMLASILAANQPVSVGTISSPSYGLIGTHAYAIIGYNSVQGTFTLYNPWGSSQPSPLTWAQLVANCTWISVGDASGTTAISAATASQGGGLILAAAFQRARSESVNTLLTASREILGDRASAGVAASEAQQPTPNSVVVSSSPIVTDADWADRFGAGNGSESGDRTRVAPRDAEGSAAAADALFADLSAGAIGVRFDAPSAHLQAMTEDDNWSSPPGTKEAWDAALIASDYA
jgi:hypothetical protein